MDGKSLVTRIAILLVGFGLLGIILELVFLGKGFFGNIIGFVFTVVLAIGMVAGQNWARWVMAIRCGFSTVFGAVTWNQLGSVDVSFFSMIRLWLLFVTIFSGAVAAYLLLSKRVNEHFNPSSGF